MIARYTRPEMAEIWSDRARLKHWLEVEYAVCEALAGERVISRKDWRELKPKLQKLLRAGGVDPNRVAEIEKTTRHDMIAFTTAVAEKVGPTSRWVHFGLTSSDVIDTALALQLGRAGALLLKDIQALMSALKRRAEETKALATIGRSHGIFAEPTSFGLKFLGWHAEWKRNHARLARALEMLRRGKLSGAVGVNAHWGPAFEAKVLRKMGLDREPVSTQVIPRDRHAEFMAVVALCGASLERMAVELRHLQRSEVGEVIEGFAKGQKGSSAMPHKRNPISGENLTGLARLMRSYAHAALEDVALWHERDISHSSVERVIFPDGTILLNYAIHRMTDLVLNLGIQKGRVKENLDRAGSTVFSGHLLLALVRAGAPREESYYWVQECAHKALGGEGDFVSLAARHAKILKYVSAAEIRKVGSLKHQLRHVSRIFSGALKKESC